MDTELNQVEQNLNGTYIDFSTFLLTKGVFLTEDKFIEEEYFKQDRKEDIDVAIDDYVTTVFKDEKFDLMVINAKYLEKDGSYRKIIYDAVEKRFPKYAAFSIGSKNYIIIIKKNELYEKIKVMPREQLQFHIDVIYLKLFNRLDLTPEEKTEFEIDDTQKEEEEIRKQRLQKHREEEENKVKNIYLPIVKKLEIYGHAHNSVIVKFPKIDIKTIIGKNRDYIRGFARKYENQKIFYVIFLFDEVLLKYTEYLVSETNTLRLDNLKPNKMYLFKTSIKLDNFYSHLSESFIFFTMMHPDNEDKIYNYYALGNNENNCMLINTAISDQKNNIDFVSTPSRLQNSKVVDFASSYESTFLLLSNHQIISSGKFFAIDRGNEQVDGDFECEKAEKVNSYYSNPYAISVPWGVHIRKICCGIDFCAAIDILGGVYSWGINDLGQLGLNLPYDMIVNQPRKVTLKYEESEDIFAVDIQAGSKHVLCSALYNEKMKIFSWGLGQGVEPVFQAKEGVPEWRIESQLKKLTNAFSPMLIKFELSHKIVKIISAFNFNAIICKDNSEKYFEINTVYTFGGVNTYQLGININFPESIHHWGFPTQVDFFTKNNLSVLDVSFSEIHTMFLVKNMIENKNEVYCCGTNDFDQTGFKEKISVMPQKIHNEIFNFDESQPEMIAAGKRQSMVICRNNKIIIFGITDFKGKNSDFTENKIRELSEFKLKPDEKFMKVKVMKNNIAILTYENKEK